MKPQQRARHGFTLAEVIVVLVISSVVVATLLAGFVALVRGLHPQTVVLAGESLPIAPTFGSFPSAVRLHQSFTDYVSTARAVYVLGGRHVSIPENAADAEVAPLKIQQLPVISDFGPGLPMDSKSFYQQYAASLGEQDTSATSDDFSIVTIGSTGGTLAVTCLVQCRHTDAAVFDGAVRTPYLVREVKLWDASSKDVLRYAYAERPMQTSNVFVGAVHTWMRYNPSGLTNEEGPTCVVFPDPWIYTGPRGNSDDIPAFSRFSYFLAVSR